LLVCARCDARWRAAGRGCLACDATSAPTLARVRSPYLGYELVICNSCGRYLKERSGPLVYDPVVERALTGELDAAAERRGLRI
jgi:formate dehydrogenase maturation protein FdhE